MTNNTKQREITPLTEGDCFLVFDRKKKIFDFPLHFHPEFEINFIYQGTGLVRVIGDHHHPIGNYELVLCGPNLLHGWIQEQVSDNMIHEITVQFHENLFPASFLNRNVSAGLKSLLRRAQGGIIFPEETAKALEPALISLSQQEGMAAYLSLLQLLDNLSHAPAQQVLTSLSNEEYYCREGDRMRMAYEFIRKNFHRKIKIEEIASALNMTVISFSRMIKQRTGVTFTDFLNSFRIGYAARLLLDSELDISDIAFRCGFFNQANFNRIFKKSRGCAPSAFRESFTGTRKFR